MKRNQEETFSNYEKKVTAVRDKNTAGKQEGHVVPNEILVQKMSSTASGRLKNYKPVNTRDFVPFSTTMSCR